ncbi:MAG: type IV secretion system DNA-binding domain-containing protein, partial [Bdellovibrionales bacterium]|nr:type IV secretion system DNA-binding domain-containing protein [Bdellovibrionales bacterium]
VGGKLVVGGAVKGAKSAGVAGVKVVRAAGSTPRLLKSEARQSESDADEEGAQSGQERWVLGEGEEREGSRSGLRDRRRKRRKRREGQPSDSEASPRRERSEITVRRGREDDDAAPAKVKKRRPKRLGRRGRGASEESAARSAEGKQEKPSKPSNFRLPPLDLLIPGEHGEEPLVDDNQLIANSRRLEQTLQDFRIGGEVVEVQPGPVITLYQFVPAAGVKVQRIINLADDIALALKVASVRVYAPVPGKGTVGIEVPNEHREIVRLRDVLSSEQSSKSDASLLLGLGKDTFGAPYVANLQRMPHLLIAGATGTGKSVCINSLLLSLLYRNTPEELQLILIDPKMLELSMYEDIPHLKSPVVTNPKRARGVLWWAVNEMDRRYSVMKDLGVRNLASYNLLARGEDVSKRSRRSSSENVIELHEKDIVATEVLGEPLTGKDEQGRGVAEKPPGAVVLEPMPRIVIVVDELADLMLTVGREVEELFTRLAQKARAAGIHLILATQRPSVNVITGLIKANFPARVSFKVATRIDSRTVLDSSGAERLLGDGDMLYSSPMTRGETRLHGAFVSDEEVADVCRFLKEQRPAQYDADIEKTITAMEEAEAGGGRGAIDDEEYDPLYDQAVQLVVEKGQASTSMVQRAFRIGYNRAARILDVMEREGVVGPADGARPREVLAPSGGDIDRI